MDNKERLIKAIKADNGISTWKAERIAAHIAAANLLAPDNLVRIGHISVDQNNMGRVVYELGQGPIAEGMPVFVSLAAPKDNHYE